MARVKICGINSPAAMDAAVAAGAEWIGFVFAPSPRQVTPDEAEALSGRHPGGPLRVGLFVDPTDAQLEAALDAVPLDILQLYAAPDRATELRTIFGIEVWRAIAVTTSADLPTDAGPVDGYVLDAPPAADATRPGGNGVCFEHAILHDWPAPAPWLLAGGLTPANVADAIRASGAAAVDVSSGVETAPGQKSPALIAAFTQAAHGAFRS